MVSPAERACYCFDSWFRAQTLESLQHHRCYNDELPACRWSWHLSPPLPVVTFNSGCPRFWLMLNLFFEETWRKIWSKRKSSYLCSPIGNALVSRTRELSSVGSERLPYKQRVGGSTPSAPTSKDSEILRVFFLFPGHSRSSVVASFFVFRGGDFR